MDRVLDDGARHIHASDPLELEETGGRVDLDNNRTVFTH